MNYTESTQKARWTFNEEQLADLRAEANMRAIEKGMAARKKRLCKESMNNNAADACAPGKSQPLSEPLTVAQELMLLKYYHQTIKQMCKKYHLRVQACALTYLKRFYLRNSAMEFDPSKTYLTCIYLAGKTEERYIPADMLSQQVKNVTQNSLLKSELALLKGLNYDLIVHTPFLEIDGFVEDMMKLVDLPEFKIAGFTKDKICRARDDALGAGQCLMMSDAVLLFPPGMLALAALRSGFTNQKLKLDPYLTRVVERSSAPGQASLEGLIAQLERIDAYGMDGVSKVNDTEVREIDRQLKEWLRSVAPPKSKSKKEARKETKVEGGGPESSENSTKKRRVAPGS